MNITEIIRERVSVRTFDSERQLTDKEISAINKAIADASSPFGGNVTIEFKKFDLQGPQRPSTYGSIEGASWFLLMGVANDFNSELSAGYTMEQIVLRCTELGLGTCWMAATFKGTDFERAAALPADQPLRIISPVGFPAAKRRILEKITRATLGSAKRKPMDSMFFVNDFSTPVNPDCKFYTALEMMRLAPSATNSQPWRALVVDNTVHFYYENKSAASVCDLGIGLCHFNLTMEHEGLKGTFFRSPDVPAHKGYIPAVSFKLL